jgi:glycosyltransferase involved in cell wall biosynthesis/GT2 family glycosyltransferase
MRICLVSREFAPFFGAGIGTYAAQMARAWAAAGHEVHVLTAEHPGVLERGPSVCPGVQFHTVSLERGRVAMDAYRFDFLRHAMAVYDALVGIERRFDYIEFPEYWAEGYLTIRAKRTSGAFDNAVLGVRLHTPTHDCRRLNREDWLDEEIAYLEHCEEASIREADIVISPTRSLLEMVSERLALPADQPSAVIPYPFDPGSISELGAPQHAPPQDAPATVLYFGRLEHRKGVHILIEAARELLDRGLDARFRLIGADTQTGPHGRSYREWVRRQVGPALADRIAFEPAKPRRELGQAIRESTLCCFPSLWENFPNACLEAMTLGAAVVGSDAGGMGEIIRDGVDGILFRSGDARSLAGTLERVIRDRDLRARISAAAPARVASLCNPVVIVREFERVIEVNRGAPAPVSIAHSAVHDSASDASAPLVSIVIPFYNLAPFLPRTLESVQAQTEGSFETIVIDDGSTDPEAASLLHEVESGRFGSVRVIRQPNAGLSAARNAGLAAARGRWVVPLDADDVLDPTFLAACVRAADRNPDATFITTLVEYFFQTPSSPHGGWIPIGIDRDLLAYTNCASTCTALIDRRALLEAGGYDPWLTSYEDWDLWCRLAARGARGLVIPEFLIHYCCRPDSMARTEGKARRDLIHACLIARHAGLPLHPDRTMRLHLARASSTDIAQERAERLIAENMRYRMVDKVNQALKAAGVQKAIKGIAGKLGGK